MRMKFNKSSQLLLASAVSLLAAGLLVACGSDTTDFVFVASSKAAGTSNYGQIDIFEINSVSGAMRQITTSPFPSGGRNPVAEAVSPDNTNLYVVNQNDNTIVQFVIGNDGKLYPQNTVNTPGVYPLAVAVNGSNLFVVDTYQPLATCSTNSPCSGSIAVYPILTATEASKLTPSEPADTLGTPVANPGSLTGATYWPLTLGSTGDLIEPTAINVLASGAYVYVTAYDATSGNNYIFGFSVGSSGVLTALNGGAPLAGGAFATGTCASAYLNAPYSAGTCPAGIASDSTSGYVYVTDAKNGLVHGYSVASGTGLLTALSGSPFSAGDQPSAIAVDTKYSYAYVANAGDNNIQAYSITNGVLTSIGLYAAGIQPVAIGIDPSTNHFVFIANYLGGTVSDFQMSATAGTLINTQGSPYAGSAQLTAVAAIPHGGSH
jgi:6-phosphogluconolactonase (cycloisomerase 2 family)